MAYGTYVLATDKTAKDNLRHLRPSCPIAEWHSISLIGHTYVNIRISACACSLCTCSDDACTFCACITGACNLLCMPRVVSTSNTHDARLLHEILAEICIHKVHNLKSKGAPTTLGPLHALLVVDIENAPLPSNRLHNNQSGTSAGVMTNP